MKSVQFRTELSQEAMNVYSNSSFEFSIDNDGMYWVADGTSQVPYLIGTIEDVEDFLKQFV